MKLKSFINFIACASVLVTVNSSQISAQTPPYYCQGGQFSGAYWDQFNIAMAQFVSNPVNVFYDTSQICNGVMSPNGSSLKTATSVALTAQGAAVLYLCSALGDHYCPLSFGPAFTFLYDNSGQFISAVNSAQRDTNLTNELIAFDNSSTPATCLGALKPWMH